MAAFGALACMLAASLKWKTFPSEAENGPGIVDSMSSPVLLGSGEVVSKFPQTLFCRGT
jgi:hypothetical protein